MDRYGQQACIVNKVSSREHQCAIGGLEKITNLTRGFTRHREFSERNTYPGIRLNKERYLQLSERRSIFFKNIDIDNIVYLISQEKRRLTEKHDSRVMIPSTEPKCDTQSFNGPMSLCRILSYHNSDPFGHV
jgi:hypothetical protein